MNWDLANFDENGHAVISMDSVEGIFSIFTGFTCFRIPDIIKAEAQLMADRSRALYGIKMLEAIKVNTGKNITTKANNEAKSTSPSSTAKCAAWMEEFTGVKIVKL